MAMVSDPKNILNKLYKEIMEEAQKNQVKIEDDKLDDPWDAIGKMLEDDDAALAKKKQKENEDVLRYMEALIKKQSIPPPVPQSISVNNTSPQKLGYVSGTTILPSGAPQSGVQSQHVSKHVDSAMNAVRKYEELTRIEIDAVNALKERVKERMYVLGITGDMQKWPGLVVAGGCFTSIWYNEEPRDYDIFMLDTPSAPLFDATLNSLTTKPIKNDDYTYKNPNIKCVYTQKSSLGGTRQYIFSKFKTVKELLNDFDLKHTRVAYDGDKLYISPSAVRAIDNKWLIPHKEKKPPYSARQQARFKKFLARGYKLGPGVTL
jgi:hypothetical protein